ncbi:MAG: hypothetical protein A4S09_14105 [Proteobacteria bacterium SG_bin7]|nr:MAG: hypothetical protein A4S09_14105 [Proteobacteria bacterium SG_bin7]
MKKNDDLQLSTVDIPAPDAAPNLTNQEILTGKVVPALDRLKIISADDWQNVIYEWVHGYLKSKYQSVNRCGGSGDFGRDVIGQIDQTKWDNYQCKHYDHALAPSDIWVEIGKLIYHVSEGNITPPENYFFIAPQGCGKSLLDLLNKPEDLRKKLTENWEKHCQKKITSKKEVHLDALKTAVDGFDFSIFSSVGPLDLLEQHGQTRWYAARFGGGLKKRPPSEAAPAEIATKEVRYVEQLYAAYSDRVKKNVSSRSDLDVYKELLEHFNRQRTHFYEAESLKKFARDSLPDGGYYEDLLSQFYDGVIDILSKTHQDGYEKLIEVVQVAQQLNLGGHILISVLRVGDRAGVCHQLANEDRLKWVK